MFTGIIKNLGRILSIDSYSKAKRIRIQHELLPSFQIGDSIAVSGCCLTIVERGKDSWAADISMDIWTKTNFFQLKESDRVNIEYPLQLSDRLHGHWVQGHIDGCGMIKDKINEEDGSFTLKVYPPKYLLKYIVSNGSIAIDGASLTVTDIDEDSFSFMITPQISSQTTLGLKEIGDLVNIEVDLIAKYIQKQINFHS